MKGLESAVWATAWLLNLSLYLNVMMVKTILLQQLIKLNIQCPIQNIFYYAHWEIQVIFCSL